jgi:hypothetical protein
MANYIGATRTNYFKVKDEAAWQPWIERLQATDYVDDFTKTDDDGMVWHAFGCYGSVDLFGPWSDEGDDSEYPVDDLQRMLPDDDACIVYHSGWEKLRFVVGSALVITSNDIKSVDIIDDGLVLAREMLGNDKFTTESTY